MAITQASRLIAVHTELGSDALLLRSLEGEEAISRPFQFTLGLLSENDAIDFSQIIGTRAAVHILDANGTPRYWNGYINKFEQERRETILTGYSAEFVPWLWFLTLRTDSRVFQGKKTPEIVEDVFDRAGFRDFEWRTQGDFRTREYCVQYQETDFDFVSRLLEDEGIFYFFEHDRQKHTMVMADHPGANRDCPGQASVRYARSSGGFLTDDRITAWRARETFQTSAVAIADHNFKTPDDSLLSAVKGDNPFEVYQYPAGHADSSEGQALADVRSEELRAGVRTATGESACGMFRAGARFSLQGHYRSDFDRAYVLTEVSHTAVGGSYDVGIGGWSSEGSSYSNKFICVPSSVVFRPIRRTARKLVTGCQTAIVVGRPGKEIDTDEFGRVKVHFHWDRQGPQGGNSSCWIRVSQNWAGDGWGSISIPRVGQEVIVDFLEGDPDRPIITGRVYNAKQMPPFKLPDGAANMGFRSKSIHGGGYNEISVNDTNASEGVTIHAQHDMRARVENDETISIGHSRDEVVGRNETVTVKMLRTHNVGANDMLNVGAAQEVSVGGAQALTVGAGRMVNVGLAQRTEVGKTYTLEAGDAIVLKSGASTLTLNKDGTIVIEGKEIAIKGSKAVVATAERIDLN